jgi:hypothetical protein
VTALIAATPLVSAGDVGRVPMSTATGHFYLTAGWFIVLAGWAIWNAWAKPGRRVVGLVGFGLIVTAALVATRATWAPNRWLAWNTAWDWLSVAAAFVVVRQVADREDDHRLFAVVLATGIAAIAALVPEHVAAMAGWSWPVAGEVGPGTSIVTDGWPATDNAKLGLAATCGLPALVVLLLTLVVCVLTVWRSSRSAPARPEPSTAPWAFYAGSIAGLLVGLMLQVGDLPPGSTSAIPGLGIAAAVRALAWFITFACVEKAAWVDRWPRTTAVVALILVTGCAVLFHMLSSAAILVGMTAAIALNLAAPPPPSQWARSGIGRFVPLVITVPLAIAFVVLIAYPGITAANAVWHARLAARAYPTKLKAIDQANPPFKMKARRDAGRFVAERILQPLAEAVKHNPTDAGSLLEQVPWWLAVWKQGTSDGAGENAVIAAQLAQLRDPESVAGYLAELQVRLRFAEATEKKRAEQYQHAEELIREIVQRDPARAARLRYQVARVAFAVKDHAKCKSAAEAALQLDENAPGPRYRLHDDERAQLRKWLDRVPGADADAPAR